MTDLQRNIQMGTEQTGGRMLRGVFFSFILYVPLFILLSASVVFAQQSSSSSSDDARITLSTEIVSLTVSVTDRMGRAVAGLAKDDFVVFDEGIRQEISHFSDTDVPASIGIVFDLSGSMNAIRIAKAREALAFLIQNAHGDDEYFLVGIGARPAVLLEKTREGEALLRRVQNITPRGSTSLYDSVALALDRIARSRHQRRALIVISDGEDTNSRLSFEGLRRRLRETDVPIWTVLAGAPRLRSNAGAIMDRLADATGGRSFFPRNEEKMNEAFSQIALELRRLYSIGYAPSNLSTDGKWRKIRVTLASSADRAVVRTREGYFPKSRQDTEADASGIE